MEEECLGEDDEDDGDGHGEWIWGLSLFEWDICI